LVLGQKIGKEEARRTMLTREQFLEVHEYQLCFDITYVMFDLLMYQLLRDVQVTPWWSRTKADAWAMKVDKWFTEEYQQAHDAARERRLMMEGPSHHQGQRSLPEYKALWVRGFFNLFSGLNLFHHTNLRPAFLVGKDTSWPGMLGLRCLVHGTQGQGDVRCVLQREQRAGGIQQP
jgi:hypothetical protein